MKLFVYNLEFVKLWRSVAVDNVDDKTIDDYLQKQGISSMEHVGLRRVVSVTYIIHSCQL